MEQLEFPLEEDDEEYIQVEVLRDEEIEEDEDEHFEGGLIAPNQVLRGALNRLREVIIIGKDPDGEYYYASSRPDGQWAIFHAERFKEFIMRQIY